MTRLELCPECGEFAEYETLSAISDALEKIILFNIMACPICEWVTIIDWSLQNLQKGAE